MSVITEDDARRMVANENIKSKSDLYVSKKEIITPSARTYLSENNITIKIKDDWEGGKALVKSEYGHNNKELKPESVIDVKETNNSSESVKYDTLFGAKLSEKPEHMTALRGNVLVFKNHPRIKFRGAIDSLESEIILLQVLAEKQNMPKLISDLEEIISFIRMLLRCEVSGEPVEDFILQGLSHEELRAHSHHPSQYYGMKHFLPSYKYGEIVAQLNHLRTLARSTELIAYVAFVDEYGNLFREDIIRPLNRLSSLFWIMMFKYLKGQYK